MAGRHHVELGSLDSPAGAGWLARRTIGEASIRVRIESSNMAAPLTPCFELNFFIVSRLQAAPIRGDILATLAPTHPIPRSIAHPLPSWELVKIVGGEPLLTDRHTSTKHGAAPQKNMRKYSAISLQAQQIYYTNAVKRWQGYHRVVPHRHSSIKYPLSHSRARAEW